MTVIAVYSLPTEEFLLGRLLARHLDVEVTLETVVPAGEDVVPYIWVSSADSEVLETIAADEMVASVRVLDSTETGCLLKITWRRTGEDVLSQVAATEGSILDGSTDDGTWKIRLRFPDREALAAFDRGCRRNGVDAHLASFHDSNVSIGEDQLLTPPQHETLRIALALGYFEVPRAVTLGELATELDVSDNAVSQRLRRGLRRLVEASVTAD